MLSVSIAGQALLLMAILWLLARDEADLTYQKMVLVVCAILAVDVAVHLACLHQGGLAVAYLLSALATVWIVKKFCWLTWNKAVLVMLIFTGFNTALDALQVRQLEALMGSPMPDEVQAVKTAPAVPPVAPPEREPVVSILSNVVSASAGVLGTHQAASLEWIGVTGRGRGARGDYAIVEGRFLPVGDVFEVDVAGTRYAWRLTDIREHDVVWEPVIAP